MIDIASRVSQLSPARRELLSRRLAASPEAAEPIAIVGMGCRFAGADSIEAYWRVIRDGVIATGVIPDSRWDADEYYDADYDALGKMATKWGGFVDNVDQFDPQFFSIAPREAERMDPQQRLLLEVAWEALEHAGVAPERLRGSSTGVFVGIGGTDYSKVACQYGSYLNYVDAHIGTGNALSIAANRISYTLDLHGPSLAIDTACSSGLVGIHTAVQSLRNWECDAALAGAVNLILAPDVTIAFSKARMLSADGKCRPFDAGANGYVRGEGCAMIVLKRLTDALRDEDNVLAVIRGSAVNQDGRTSGITAPNSLYQQAAIRAALAEADLTPDDVSYVEAHGTGTPLGDPIEVQALSEVFRRRGEQPPVCVTSVKANIGHTETVSGVAGIIKTVLLMQHEQIMPQAHLQTLNPYINLDGTRLCFPTEAVAWNGAGRIAGVSSFGFGGTNAHVVLEAAPPREQPQPPKTDRSLHVLTVSAKSKTALSSVAAQYAEYLRQNEHAAPADVCHSANAGRSHFNHRLAVAADSREKLIESLAAIAEGKRSAAKQSQVSLAARPRIAFLLTGQGSQYAGMGRALYESQPVFRRAIDRCDELLREHLERPLLSVLYLEDGTSPIDETAYTQPALFAVEYALDALWQSWGVEPDLVLGHSVGEYVAAVVAGVMSLEDGLTLIAHRARLMQALPRDGSMAVVFAPRARVEAAIADCADSVSIAAANGPENTVLSGRSETVRALSARFEAEGVRVQPLVVSHAFHSPLMEPMLDEFELIAAQIEYHRPRMAIVSNVTGQLAGDDTYNARYWRDHVRGTVCFEEGVRQIDEQQIGAVVEIGPAPVLLGMGRRCLPKSEAQWLPSLRKGQDDEKVMLGTLSELYLAGAKINWIGFDRAWPRQRLVLPTYPFERQRMWMDLGEKTQHAAGGTGPKVHPLLGRLVPNALESTLYEVPLSARSPKYLRDHQVQGSAVTPAAAYLEQGLAAARQAFGPGCHALENVSIQQAMFLADDASRTVQVAVAPELGGQCTFETYSIPATGEKPTWQMHAAGTLRHDGAFSDAGAENTDSTDARPAQIDLASIDDRVTGTLSRDEFYQTMSSRGLAYGPAFQVLAEMRRTDREAIAKVMLSDEVVKESEQYLLHPALLDGCLQAMAAAIPLEADGTPSPYTYMPVGVRRLRMHGEIGSAGAAREMYVYLRRTTEESGFSPETVEADVLLLDAEGSVLVELEGVRVQRLGRAGEEKASDPRDWLYEIEWRASPLEGAASKDAASITTSPPADSDSPTAPAPSPENKEVRSADLPQTLSGNWLILADRGGAAEPLAAQIEQRGGRAILVDAGEKYAALNDGNDRPARYTVDPLSPTDYSRLIEQALGGERPDCRGVIHLWSLDIPDAEQDPTFAAARRLGCGAALRLVQQFARAKFAKTPHVWLVTIGAQAVSGGDEAISLTQSPLWGLGRVAALEHPELRVRLIDLDPSATHENALAPLLDELAAEAAEDQIAYRGSIRFIARLAPNPDALPISESAGNAVPAEGSFRVRLGKPGSIDSLRFESFTRERPDPRQVEIEVRAAGLNFSDVLKAMGLYPGIKDKIVPLGIECSGVVSAVGEGVTRFQLGDAVMGVAPYSFATHARTAEFALVHKPAAIDDCQACTVPITFLTAYYALVRLAQLQPGERVLIHAGAGGVGLAAIQIAQHVGAEIFATAGSDEKRDFLRRLGVPHVMNSRTLDFADEILRITGRRGVDVVLNSLPGEAIERSIALLSAYGRFCEIGKIDIYQNRKIGLLPFQDNLSYFAIDLDRMLRQRPDYMQGMFTEMMRAFESGAYQPLNFERFPIEDTVAAFRYMAQRKNIGKVVVSLEGRQSAGRDAAVNESATGDVAAGDAAEAVQRVVRRDGTYLVTGGLGALGLRLAGWLAERGAGAIVLMSRRGPNEQAQAAIDELTRQGARIHVAQGDVADRVSLAAALAGLPSEFPPLRGVIHAAGVLDDGVMFDMQLGQLDRAMAPKVQGAWNLHAELHATRADAELDFFVLFSSVASVLGSPGQANYAAGNAFLDGLAAYRASRGLPVACINWGPWADGGMAAEAGRDQQLAARGMDALPAREATQLLERLLVEKKTHIAVMSARWGDMLKQSTSVPPLLRDVAPRGDAAQPESAEDAALRAELLAADPEARKARLVEYFSDQLAAIMGLQPDEIDVIAPLNTLGLDSLMAIELKNKIESRLNVVLPMARFMEGPSVSTLAEAVSESIAGGGTQPAEATDTNAATAQQRTAASVLSAQDAATGATFDAALDAATGAAPATDGKSTESCESAASAESAVSADRMPLTHGQEALWFIHRLAPDSTAYNLADAIRLHGPLNVEALHRVIQKLVERHAVFRTTFHDDDGRPYQRVHDSMTAPFSFEDASTWTAEQIERRLQDEAHRPFDLEHGPPGRMVVLKEADDRHVIVFVVHHIIADMWSMVACTDEIRQMFAAELLGEELTLPAPKIEFADFARRQREMLAGAEGGRLFDYWRQELAGDLPVLELPTDKPRPKLQTYDGELMVRVVGRPLAEQVQRLAERRGATLNMVLLAAYQMLLARYTGQDDILVGTPTSCRTRSELNNVIGYFVNPVVIRGDLSGDPTAAAFIEQVRGKMIGALDHQEYPFPLLVERLAPKRDAARPPIFQTMFAMQRFHAAKREGLTPFLAGATSQGLDAHGMRVEPAGLRQRITPFDLSLTVSEGDDDGIALAMQYNTDLFERGTIERMLAHFENLLASLVEDDERPVGELPLLSADEQRQLLLECNETRRDYPPGACLHELFEAQAKRTPNAAAVVCGDTSLTYRELNQRANQLAHHLRRLGVGPESAVGVCLGRGAEMIVALLGILKAGGAYVPVDPDLPTERKRFMVADAAIRVLVTESKLTASLLDFFTGEVVLLDDPSQTARRSKANPKRRAALSDRAYVIYTSGSTGQPKGVEIEHVAVVNYVRSAIEQFEITPADRVLQFASISFDASAEEIFPALASGASLVIRDDGMSLVAERFLDACEAEGVTVLDLPTAYWRQLLQETAAQRLELPPSLRLLIIGGERAAPQDLALWRQCAADRIRLFNTYGPTEATIVATTWEAPPELDALNATRLTEMEIPIGRPVANVQAYVLDRNFNLVPAGVPGELFIAGAGLARGYLNRPELTAERFVTRPVGTGRETRRMYRTGDLVRRRVDGNLEFLGRVDDQVKIRGFRVELGEIEAALAAHERIRQCAVQPWSMSSGLTQLAAYIVLHDAAEAGDAPTTEELRELLARSLPEYMVPACFITLPELPLTRSNKLDRKALPEPAATRPDLEVGFIAPRSDVEKRLAAIWQELLGVDPIGVRDNFFELGGHSLLAVQLISRVARNFGRELPLASLLGDGTIERMAARLERLDQIDDDGLWSPLVPIRPHGSLPPLFCIHPAGGNVLCYHELAQHVAPERPVFALEARGADGRQPPHATLDEMVEDYITAIRQMQPAGPYHLVGWSSGGVVAYEIARRLREAGESIASVSLLDSRVMSSLDFDPDDESRILVTLADFLERFYGLRLGVSYDELERIDRDARLTNLLERARGLGQLPLELDAADLRRFVEVARANLKILHDYVPPASDLPVRLFRAAERLGEQDADLSDDLGWHAIVGDALAVAPVPGDHISMMTAANAQPLGLAIEAATAGG